MHQIQFRLGLSHIPRRRAYNAPQTSYLAGRAICPLSKPHPRSLPFGLHRPHRLSPLNLKVKLRLWLIDEIVCTTNGQLSVRDVTIIFHAPSHAYATLVIATSSDHTQRRRPTPDCQTRSVTAAMALCVVQRLTWYSASTACDALSERSLLGNGYKWCFYLPFPSATSPLAFLLPLIVSLHIMEYCYQPFH